ncbi:hypothetical protein EG329_002447 [Mollisiaceae sp. DMI_Dod_QoI]|nr:hypothetical protein EG329_002447 [Helotiales sp. DMI_Dod_QoI]
MTNSENGTDHHRKEGTKINPRAVFQRLGLQILIENFQEDVAINTFNLRMFNKPSSDATGERQSLLFMGMHDEDQLFTGSTEIIV